LVIGNRVTSYAIRVGRKLLYSLWVNVSVHFKTIMRNILYIILFFASISSCSTSTGDKYVVSKNSDTLSIEVTPIESANECDFVYDTIKNEKYSMHLSIMDKYNHKEKRGYVRDSNGDTLNNFLFHQDIAVFANGLDSTEKGIYKKLTNKVIFLILEHDPRMLDYGLTQWTTDVNDLNYFMYHVSHPTCNTIPADSLKNIIMTEMGEPHEGAKKVKQILLDNLDASKD
jgi:hypothetical protein